MRGDFLFPFDRVRLWVFCALCFALPTKVGFVYILSTLLLILWFADRSNIREKFNRIITSKLCVACVVYFCVYVLAMLWTEDIKSGWHMVGRQIPFLLFPLYYTSIEPDKKEKYITAFVIGVCVCAVFAHYNFFQMNWFTGWPRGVRVHKGHADTAPFVDWIMYTPILALGTCFSLRCSFFATKARSILLFGMISILLLSNLSFSGGRAGLVMFAGLLAALIFERIKTRRKAIIGCVFILPLVFGVAYFTVEQFSLRVDRAVHDIRTFEKNPNTSVGQRLVFYSTTLKIVADHPIFGVGSGDYPAEYSKNKPKRWAMTPDTVNPHNQFLLTAATTGLLGLTILLYIFYTAASNGDIRARSFLFGYIIVCMFESYLWRSNTSLTFFVLLAVLLASQKQKI